MATIKPADQQFQTTDKLFGAIIKADTADKQIGNVFSNKQLNADYEKASKSKDPNERKSFIERLITADYFGGEQADKKTDAKVDGKSIFNLQEGNQKDDLLKVYSETLKTMGLNRPQQDQETNPISINNSPFTPDLNGLDPFGMGEVRALVANLANTDYRNKHFPGITAKEPGSVKNLPTPKFNGNLEQLIKDTIALYKPRVDKLIQEGVLKSEQEFTNLIKAMIQQESGGKVNAVSHAGARGLMQLMPGTARDLGVNPDDPADNIKGGVAYILDQLETFKNIPQALAAYNAGPGNVRKNIKNGGDGLPNNGETKGYVHNITGMMKKLMA